MSLGSARWALWAKGEWHGLPILNLRRTKVQTGWMTGTLASQSVLGCGSKSTQLQSPPGQCLMDCLPGPGTVPGLGPASPQSPSCPGLFATFVLTTPSFLPRCACHVHSFLPLIQVVVAVFPIPGAQVLTSLPEPSCPHCISHHLLALWQAQVFIPRASAAGPRVLMSVPPCLLGSS